MEMDLLRLEGKLLSIDCKEFVYLLDFFVRSNSSKASSKKATSAASTSLRSPPPPLPQQDANFGTTYRLANVSNQNAPISYQSNLVQGALGGKCLNQFIVDRGL